MADAIERARECLIRAGMHEDTNTAIGLVPYAVVVRAMLAFAQQAPEGWEPIADAAPGHGYMAAFKAPLRKDGRYEIIGPGHVTAEHGYRNYLGPWQGIELVYKLPPPAPPAMLDASPSVGEGV